MDKMYIGIDVGAKGFISTQYNGDWLHYAIADYDLYQLGNIFQSIRKTFKDVTCVIEDVHAIFGSSAKATFQFGFNKGYLIGLLSAYKIPYTLVQPKEWQKCMWQNSDLVVNYKTMTVKGKQVTKKEINTKQTSLNCVKRLFPTMDFRKSERAKKVDDNKIDSILMCEYARRNNL
jgi:hypothetical protein